MRNIENLANTIIPHMVKGIILIGAVMCLTSVTIAGYSYLRKKQTLKEIKTYLSYTFGTGILCSLSGLLVNFIVNFDISFSSYKYSIPAGYILSLVVFISLAKNYNKTN